MPLVFEERACESQQRDVVTFAMGGDEAESKDAARAGFFHDEGGVAFGFHLAEVGLDGDGDGIGGELSGFAHTGDAPVSSPMTWPVAMAGLKHSRADGG